MREFQIRWGGISHLKPLRRYLRYFRGIHWRSSVSHRLLAFYTWVNRVTNCLYAAQCRSRGMGEWLKRLFCGHGRSCPPLSGGAHIMQYRSDYALWLLRVGGLLMVLLEYSAASGCTVAPVTVVFETLIVPSTVLRLAVASAVLLHETHVASQEESGCGDFKSSWLRQCMQSNISQAFSVKIVHPFYCESPLFNFPCAWKYFFSLVCFCFCFVCLFV